MTDFTPSTAQVRDTYVRAMRNAFIASAGEHREEFDRWIADHDRAVAEKAWAEGFDTGERDVHEHVTFDEPCIPNPYRRQEQS